MKSFVVLAVLVAAALAAPQGYEKDAQIVSQLYNNFGDGNSASSFETSNGIKANENIALKNAGTENEGIEVTGSFSYPGPDGVIYEVRYIADKDGFRPDGPHLPKAPQY